MSLHASPQAIPHRPDDSGAVEGARRPGQTVPVELMPNEAGEFAFGCPMGMFRGNLIVE